jgi:hypothetical protein
MPQSKIIVDTNSYLRLAQTIRPLLFMPFGDKEYCLYILPELNDELSVNRLKSKFPWTEDAEYVENRKHFPVIGKKQKKAIKEALEFIWDFVDTELPGPSKVDALYIAYAQELDIPVVTDDQDMTQLAIEFDVIVMPTLELLKLMHDCEHVKIETIKAIIDYWRAIDDRPANLSRDIKRFFPKL